MSKSNVARHAIQHRCDTAYDYVFDVILLRGREYGLKLV